MREQFVLFGLQFSTYWTVFAFGVISMLIINYFRGKKRDIKAITSIALTLGVVLISFIGAKILYYIENPNSLLTKGLRFDGVSFFGSVFLVPILMILIAKVLKRNYYQLMDFISPSLMLMLAVLRVGCYLSGCCGGVMINTSSGSFRFPTQITECIIDILIMFGLLFYEKFWKNNGRLYFFIMVYYAAIRFLIEFLRDTPKEWFGFSHGQWFAVVSVCIGGYMLYYLGKKDKKEKKRAYKRK